MEKRIGAYKILSDETLKSKKKAELIETIRILEHNWAVTEESLNNSALNSFAILTGKNLTLQNMAEWLANDCNEDTCKLCVHEEEAEEATRRTGQDIPEDVEPCKFKREKGCSACVDGIIEYFKSKS